MKRLDLSFILPAFIIFLLGQLTILSIDFQLAKSQLIFFIFGAIAFFLIRQVNFVVWSSFAPLLYFLSLILLAITLIIGQITRGTHRWIQVGSLTFQSAELVKPLLIIFFSWLACNFPLKNIKNIFIQLLFFLLPVFLIFKQPDLGTTIIIFLIWIGLNFAFGLKKRYLFAGLFIFLLSLPISWRFLEDYQKERIFSFINPKKDLLGSGYNLFQSKIAVGSGGMFGKGLGSGTQSQLKFLPERHSDFIFASLSEEWGFLGSFLTIFLYFVLLMQILKAAQKTESKFSFTVCIGVFMMIFAQTVINIGMNVGLLPITGITLPFISAGGSSLMTTTLSLGLVESVSGPDNKEQFLEIK